MKVRLWSQLVVCYKTYSGITKPYRYIRVGYVGLKLSEMLYMTQKDIRQSLVLNSEKKREKEVKRRGFDNMILLIY